MFSSPLVFVTTLPIPPLAVAVPLALLLLLLLLLYLRLNAKISIDPRHKAVLVTGAANGLGLSLAKRCFAAGCIVFALDLSEQDLETSLAHEIRTDPRRMHTIEADVTRPDHIARAHELVRVTLQSDASGGGQLFALVNNAGIARSRDEATLRSMLEMPSSEMEAMFAVNVFGYMRMVNAFYPLLARDTADWTRAGVVVNVASLAGLISGPYFNYYCATKHAVVGYTASLAAELRPMGVRCRCIAPSFADTRIIELPPIDSDSPWKPHMQSGSKAAQWLMSNPMPAERVSSAMFDAVFTHMPHPPTCDMVCSTAERVAVTLARLFNRLPV